MCILKFWLSVVVFIGLVHLAASAFLVLFHDNFPENTTQPLATAEKLLESSFYDRNKLNFIFASGFNNKKNGPAITAVTTTMIDTQQWNMFLCDWEYEASDIYSTSIFSNDLSTDASYATWAAPNALKVGNDLGLAAIRMSKLNFSIAATHFVGFSLGAQLIGQAARTVKANGITVPRVTGLEPARPLFYPPTQVYPPLTKNDADLVDCWHTDNNMGTNATICSFDNRFNYVPFTNPDQSQRLQPGCTNVLCNHDRVWMLYVESVRNFGTLVAALAGNVWEWVRGQGDCAHPVYLGLNINTSTFGVYYLNTSSSPLYGLGIEGSCPYM